MKYPLRIAMVCFLISVAATLGFYYAGQPIIAAEQNFFWNIFLLLTAIALSLFMVKKQANFEDKTFVEDFKVAMQGGLVFVVLISLFVYVYHTSVDTNYIETRLTERMDYTIDNVPDEAAFAELQEADPTWQDKSYLDFIENQEDQAVPFISAKSLATGYLGFGLFMAMFFSIFTTFIFRKVVMRDMV